MKRSLKSNQFWLYASLISLAFFYLNLTWKTTGDYNLITVDLLGWIAILILWWRKCDRFGYNSNLISFYLGWLLIILVVIKSSFLFWWESDFLKFAPTIILFSFALLTSGVKRLPKYWLELFISAVIFSPTIGLQILADNYLHLSVLTAKVAGYFLYYLGFNTITQGNIIEISLGQKGNFTAIVDFACTGIAMIILMLKLSILLASIFPLKRSQRLFFPIAAVSLGFLLGVIRVCVMVLVLPEPDKFDYWHSSEGAQIFSTGAILIFSYLCHLAIDKNSPTNLTQNNKKELISPINHQSPQSGLNLPK